MDGALFGEVHLLLVGLLHLSELLLVLLLLLELVHLLLLLLLHLVHLLLLVLDHDHALLLHELDILLLLLLLLRSTGGHHRLGTSDGRVIARLHLSNVGVLLHHLLLLKGIGDAHPNVGIVRDDLRSHEAVLLLLLLGLLLAHHLVLHDDVLLNVLTTRTGDHPPRRHGLAGHTMLWRCHPWSWRGQPSRE